jgi:N-6 DNA Methylase
VPGTLCSLVLRLNHKSRSDEHIRRFSDLVEAKTINAQRYLWQQFSFRYIPVDVLNHLYQHFAQKGKGAVFTPPTLANLILDYAMPYHKLSGMERILDPTCGSGIFLVGAFRRLVHLWQSKNGWQQPDVATLILSHRHSSRSEILSFMEIGDERCPLEQCLNTIEACVFLGRPLRGECSIAVGCAGAETGLFWKFVDEDQVFIHSSSRAGKISDELRTQYVLAYYPTHLLASSDFRRIQVKVKEVSSDTPYLVRHRTGYYTTKSKF